MPLGSSRFPRGGDYEDRTAGMAALGRKERWRGQSRGQQDPRVEPVGVEAPVHPPGTNTMT